MKNWEELKNVLESQNISSEDQQMIREFLNLFSFKKRQQLMGILTGWPEKIKLFADLIKKKKALAEKFDANLAQEILNLENKEISNIIRNLQ